MRQDISDDIADLYQAVILEHNKNPRNFRKMDDYTSCNEGFNPVCGDRFFVYLKLGRDHETIVDISFEGEGCAISKASASMMTMALKGKKIDDARVLFSEFNSLLKKEIDPDSSDNHLGKLKLFSGVWQFPARIKCASLSWHTMKAAVDGDSKTTQTE